MVNERIKVTIDGIDYLLIKRENKSIKLYINNIGRAIFTDEESAIEALKNLAHRAINNSIDRQNKEGICNGSDVS